MDVPPEALKAAAKVPLNDRTLDSVRRRAFRGGVAPFSFPSSGRSRRSAASDAPCRPARRRTHRGRARDGPSISPAARLETGRLYPPRGADTDLSETDLAAAPTRTPSRRRRSCTARRATAPGRCVYTVVRRPQKSRTLRLSRAGLKEADAPPTGALLPDAPPRAALLLDGRQRNQSQRDPRAQNRPVRRPFRFSRGFSRVARLQR
jgi:hypothetical protein